MAWEKRERGGLYYTRSRKANSKVVREYVGGGALGKIAALEDEQERCRREEEAAFWQKEKERFEQDVAFLDDLEAAAKILATAYLLAAGCHEHKGEWRRLRESARIT